MSVSFATSSSILNSVTVATSTNEEASLSSTTIATELHQSSPDLTDDGDGLAVSAGVDAMAVGNDTLTYGSIEGAVVDGTYGSEVDIEAVAVAVAQSSDGDATALATSYAEVSESSELVFSSTITTENVQQDASGTTAVSTSTSNVVAYDFQQSSGGDAIVVADDEETGSTSLPTDPDAWEIDGNIAIVEVDVSASAEDSLVAVEAFALTVEDDLSLSLAVADLAIG